MTATLATKQRIQSIDILRGAIMLIMALDHVRDFFMIGGSISDPTNMATTTPILFFTRWITHYCAPTFVFLSGVSAYLAGTRRTKKQLSAFLVKRGIWLVLIEFIVISFELTLNPFFNGFAMQVIWAIGMSMIILGILVWLPVRAIALIGLALFLGHNLFDTAKLPETGVWGVLLKIFFTSRGTVLFLDKTHVLFVLYAVLPWTGIMLLGYVFGTLYKTGYDAVRRKKILIASGLTLLTIFLALRLINGYGDPSPWSVQKDHVFTILSFLNVSKYPPSLMYSCMTLSVGMFVLAFTEKAIGKLAKFFIVYGNVPFFYYVLHFFVIRLLSVIVFFLQGFPTSKILPTKSPFLFNPPEMGFTLGGVYVVWLGVILSLYYPCKWFSNYKKTHTQWWLSYL